MRPPLLGLTIIVLIAGPALAQTVVNPQTNPGVIQNQNRQNENEVRQQNDQTLAGPPLAPVNVPKTVVGPPGGAKFLLREVVFNDSAFITKSELDTIVAPYIATKVDISQIQKIVKAINDVYADRGIVTASARLAATGSKVRRSSYFACGGQTRQGQRRGQQPSP